MGFHFPGGGGGISNVVEDTTPQLGGDLDCQAFDIENVTEIYIGDRSTNGTWRISDVGGELKIELRESGTYNEKGSFLA